MRAVADKRSAFALVDLRALERIDVHVPKRDVPGARNMLLTLCQVATIEMAARDRIFDASRRLLMEKGSVSENTLDKHIATLEKLGLVEVERRFAGRVALPNRYALLDSPEPGAPISAREANDDPRAIVAGGVNDCPQATATPGQGTPQPLPPLRARPEPEKKEEERERERARANPGIDDQGSGQSETEMAIAAELAAVLASRDQELTARDRLAIRGAVHAAPDGVDVVAAAARIRKHYSAGGKAEHRRIGDIVALLLAEVQRSSAGREPSPRSSSRRRAAAPSGVKSIRPPNWTIHDARADLDPPDRELAEAWQRARLALRDALLDGRQTGGYVWGAIVEPVGLAGVYTTEVTELHESVGEHRSVIVVDAPADVVEQTADDRWMRGIARALENELGEHVIVELARRDERTAVAA